MIDDLPVSSVVGIRNEELILGRALSRQQFDGVPVPERHDHHLSVSSDSGCGVFLEEHLPHRLE